jgi:hypothetical protein
MGIRGDICSRSGDLVKNAAPIARWNEPAKPRSSANPGGPASRMPHYEAKSDKIEHIAAQKETALTSRD